MAIVVKPCDDPHCEGAVLTVKNRSVLAKAVALILAQQYSAAKKVAAGKSPRVGPLQINADAIVAERLSAVGKDGKFSSKLAEHRDGLIFQLIAWIAACASADERDYVHRPHLIKAAKGIDAGIVHFNETFALSHVSICEDKATEHPRQKMTQQVWPEIDSCERGEKDEELRTFAIEALVRRDFTDEEAEGVVGAIIWAERRRYRVRTTVGEVHKDAPKRGDLFKGFDLHAPGDRSRRRGETLYLSDLRTWMSSFAELVEQELRNLEAKNV